MFPEHSTGNTPKTGADGKRFIDIVRALGMRCDTIPVKSLGSLAQNARIITDWCAARPINPGETLVLVSFSKGSADVKTALLDGQNHCAFKNVSAWLSVGGLLHGTPLISWLERRPLRYFFVRQLLRVKGVNPKPLEELRHGPSTPLHAPTLLPTWLKTIHLIAFPTASDLSMPLARRAFNRLLPLGLSDGGGLLLGDLCRYPGLIYPLRQTDHYLRTAPQLPQLLNALLTFAAKRTIPA